MSGAGGVGGANTYVNYTTTPSIDAESKAADAKATAEAKKAGTTGGGVAVDGSSTVPDAAKAKAPGGDLIMSSVLEGLSDLLTGKIKTPEDVALLVAEIVQKVKQQIEASQKGKIDNEKNNQTAINEEKLKKMEESLKELEASGALDGANGIMGWFKVALNFISAAVQIGIGVFLIATGAGAAVGGLLIAKGVLDGISAADAAVKQATGNGIAGNIVKAFGGSDEAAMWADVGTAITLSVASIAVSIASMRVDGAAEAMAGATKMVADVQGIVTGLATTATDIATAVTGFVAAEKQGNALEMNAQKEKLNALLEVFSEQLNQAFQQLQKSGDTFSAELAKLIEAANEQSDTVSNQTFTA